MRDVDEPRSRRYRHGCILELLGGIALYLGYDWLRDQATGTSAEALRHAEQIVSAEQFLGLYHEHSIQQAFLGADCFLAFWNIYYGTIHFVLPVVALVWLYRSVPARYLLWRNTLLFMLGFARRLLPLSAHAAPPHARTTTSSTPRPRTSTSGPRYTSRSMRPGSPAPPRCAVGNLFAAMPSLHVGWSTWVALSLWPLVRRRWARPLALYPVTIIFCIVVTANHWVLDASAVGSCSASVRVCRGVAWIGACRRGARGRQSAVGGTTKEMAGS
jgi:hypothetical protein